MWKYSITVVVALGMMFGAAKKDITTSPLTVKKGVRVAVVDNGSSGHVTAPNPEDTLRYDDPASAGSNAIGLTSGGTYQAAIRFTSTELGPYDGNTLVAVSFYHYEVGTHSGRIIIYGPGTPTSPGDTLTTESYTVTGQGFFRVDLSSPVTIDGSQDMWVSVQITHNPGEYPIGVDAGPAVDGKGDWVYSSSAGIQWSELQDFGLDYNWDIMALIETGPPPDHDVATTAIIEPTGIYFVGDVITPTATFRNNGSNSETFGAFFVIHDASMNVVYMDSAQLTLDPGNVVDYSFTDYTASDTGNFHAVAWVELAGDQNPANDTATSTFTVYSGQLDYIVIDPDPTPFSGPFIDQVLSGLGLVGTYTTDPAEVTNLSIYKSLWYTAGIYSNNYRIPPDEGAYIETFLQNGGNAYFEGSDLWGYDPSVGGWNILPWTGIVNAFDGTADLFNFDGIANSLIPDVEGNSYSYTGENNWIDQLTPGPTMGGTSEAIFQNTMANYYCGVAYDQGTWKTVSASFEIAGSQATGSSVPADTLIKWIADFFGLTTGVEESSNTSAPSLRLVDARPNPVLRKTVIEFSIPMASNVNLSIYDASGRHVTTLVNDRLEAGNHRVTWKVGKETAAGVYFYKLTVGKKAFTKKLIVLR